MVSIVLSLRTRLPLPVTWTIPGLVYLGTLGSLLVAAGSILEYLLRTVAATVQDLASAGSVLAGYLAARFLGSARIPPVGAALLTGAAATALAGEASIAAVAWHSPELRLPDFRFDPAAIAAVSVPLVVLAMGLGNVQGLGYVMAQGYRVPVDRVSRAVALAFLANALFGAALASLVAALPATFVIALAGVALVSSMQDALEKAFTGSMRFGALVAFITAATPFSLLGITSAFWALIAGLLASLVAERAQLLEFWRAGMRVA